MDRVRSKKISREWIRETRRFFLEFLEETGFPDVRRTGERGPEFRYPEWLIMFIAILSVKLGVNTYLGIHRMVSEYWDVLSEGLELEVRAKVISERQLRDRLKKISHYPGRPAAFIFQIFPELEEEQDSKRR